MPRKLHLEPRLSGINFDVYLLLDRHGIETVATNKEYAWKVFLSRFFKEPTLIERSLIERTFKEVTGDFLEEVFADILKAIEGPEIKDQVAAMLDFIESYPPAFDLPLIAYIRHRLRERNTPQSRRLLEKMWKAYRDDSKRGAGTCLDRIRTRREELEIFQRVAELQLVQKTPPQDTYSKVANEGRKTTQDRVRDIFSRHYSACVLYRTRRANAGEPEEVLERLRYKRAKNTHIALKVLKEHGFNGEPLNTQLSLAIGPHHKWPEITACDLVEFERGARIGKRARLRQTEAQQTPAKLSQRIFYESPGRRGGVAASEDEFVQLDYTHQVLPYVKDKLAELGKYEANIRAKAVDGKRNGRNTQHLYAAASTRR